MRDLDQDVRTFLLHLDALSDRLRPKRRPRDAGAPECSPRELRALTAVGRHGRLAMSELAAHLDVPLSTATRTVERLVANGLLERTQSRRDRRIVEIRFGRRGKRINQYVDDSRLAAARSMLDVLTPRERTDLFARLARIVDT